MIASDKEQRVTADFATLTRQAGMTADEYLGDAIQSIDARLGAGYAAKHPELIGAFMQTCAADFTAASIIIASQNIGGSFKAIKKHMPPTIYDMYFKDSAKAG